MVNLYILRYTYSDSTHVHASYKVDCILTKAPLHIGETVWASQTSALMLDVTPTETDTRPITRCIVARTTTATTTAYTMLPPGHPARHTSQDVLLRATAQRNSPGTSQEMFCGTLSIYPIYQRRCVEQNQRKNG